MFLIFGIFLLVCFNILGGRCLMFGDGILILLDVWVGSMYLLGVMYWCFYNLKYIYICSELMYVVININLGI